MGGQGFYYKTKRPWLNQRLTNAAIVGHATTTSVKLWVRAWEEDPEEGEQGQPLPVSGDGLYWLVACTQPIEAGLGQPFVELRDDGPCVVLHGATETLLPGVVHLSRVQLRFATDLTSTVLIEGLEPGTRYHYALFAGFERPQRWEIGDSEPHFFRTQQANPSQMSFGVFSCHQPFTKSGVKNLEMFDALSRALSDVDGDYVLAVGDQIYSDGYVDGDIWKWLDKVQQEPDLDFDDMVSWYRDVYRGFWGFKQVQQLLARFPTYMIWDDHEIADGWGSSNTQEIALAKLGLGALLHPERAKSLVGKMFDAARQVYREYQHAHNPDTVEAVFDYGFGTGFVKTYVLDMRSAHTKATLLGEAQYERLADWLAAGPGGAKAVFIVSPVPVVHFKSSLVNAGLLNLPLLPVKDDLTDEREHETHQAERARLLELVSAFSEQHGVPVVFLSGDVHMSAAFELCHTQRPNACVFQLTTSGITYSGGARVPPIQALDNGVTHANGPLAGADHWSVFRLQSGSQHNFAMLRCALDEKVGVRLSWTVHVPGADESTSAQMRRLDFYPPARIERG